MTGYRLHGRDRLQDAILALPERSVMNVYSGVPCSSSTSISLSVFTGDSACAAMGGSSACDCSRWPAPLTAPRHSLGSRTCTSRLARIRDVQDQALLFWCALRLLQGSSEASEESWSVSQADVRLGSFEGSS